LNTLLEPHPTGQLKQTKLHPKWDTKRQKILDKGKKKKDGGQGGEDGGESDSANEEKAMTVFANDDTAGTHDKGKDKEDKASRKVWLKI
jgi:hypothetical protein